MGRAKQYVFNPSRLLGGALMKRLLAPAFGLVALLVAYFASYGQSDAILQTIKQINGVTVEVDVGVPPALPTAGPGGSAGGSQAVSMAVGPPLTTYHMSLSNRRIVFAAAPGQTVTQPCPLQIDIVNEPTGTLQNLYSIDIAARGNFTGFAQSFSEATSLQYQSVNYQGVHSAWQFMPSYDAHKGPALFTSYEQNATYCVPLQLKVPAGTKPGKYFGTFDLIYYDAYFKPAATPPPSYPVVVLADHPSQYFHLDQPAASTLTDVSGNGNDASGSGFSAVPGAIANYSDPAFLLANDNQISGSPTYQPTVLGFSVEGWVKTATTNQ